MSPIRLRWVLVAGVVCVLVAGLTLMALYRPLTVGMGLFVLGLMLFYPVARWARRSRVAADAPVAE